MDIIDLLLLDHDDMRLELVNINRGLLKPDLPDRLRNFIAHLTVHESVESDILFKKVRETSEPEFEEHFLSHYRSEHSDILKEVAALVKSLEIADYRIIQHNFFAFDAFVESHLRDEERFLFPVLRKKLSPQLLMALGAEAESRLNEYQKRPHITLKAV